ncbi:MAG: cysteine desulfurase [Treponema sp.]|jgi:cysteine desulfurase|nr:cysteine desulfurase [Treponema sp.]
MIRRYYFDWAATAVPGAFPAEGPPLGNPSANHLEGRQARQALETARRRCAAVLGTPENQLYFTSGATEANAIVLHSLLLRPSGSGGLLFSRVEHPAIRENARVLERLGKPVTPVAVESGGQVSPDALQRALEKSGDPRMAAIIGVQNETGAVMDLKTLGAVLRNREGPAIHFHSDLVQGAGKIPLDLRGWDLDSASFSGHKLGGPCGIGLLYLRKPLEPLSPGGGQEGGIRPGTENIQGASALASCLERRASLEAVQAAYAPAAERWKALIQALRETGRCVLLPKDRQDEDRRFSPYILQAAFDGIPGETLVRALDERGFAVSTGSACSSKRRERPVLAAMGLDAKTSLEGVRISQGWTTTEADIEALIGAVKNILRVL